MVLRLAILIPALSTVPGYIAVVGGREAILTHIGPVSYTHLFPDSGEYIDSNHPDELLLGLDSLQAESLSECIALEVDCCLPQLTGILDQYDSASELVRHAIDFGYVWAEQGQGCLLYTS